MTTILQDELLQQIMAHPHYGLLLIMDLEKCKRVCDIIKGEDSSKKKKTVRNKVHPVKMGIGLTDVSIPLFVSLWFQTLLDEHGLLL